MNHRAIRIAYPCQPALTTLPARAMLRTLACAVFIAAAAHLVAATSPAFAESVGPAAAIPAEIAPDPLVVETLGTPGPHWLWLNDGLLASSRLFNADTGKMLGMVTISTSTSALEWNINGGELLNVGAYYSRGGYGTRADVVQIRSLKTLLPVGEVVFPESPPKLANGYPLRAYSGLLDGGEFMAVYNFNPTMSVTIVNARTRTYVGEILTAGCGLVMPSASNAFLQLCGDGTVQRIRLDAAGNEADRARTKPFFDAENDPLMDRPVRNGESWLYNSYSGRIFSVSSSRLKASPAWSVQGSADAGWRPGGRMPLAVHRAQGKLFVLMHEGGADTHEELGKQVWVFDLKTKTRIARFTLAGPTVAIDVSQDEAPLLYAINGETRELDVYSAIDGSKQRSIGSIGIGVTIIQAMN